MSDRRALFANDTVAHVSLRGQVKAARFLAAENRRVAVPVANLYAAPDAERLDRQLLFGATFEVLEERDGMAFGRAGASGYVGYLRASALAAWQAPTHMVSARQTLAFSAPDLKVANPTGLSLGSLLCITGQQGRYAQTSEGWFVPSNHIRPISAAETDPVAVAARLLGTAYLWGGNSAFGIDCSGLVQIALQACGADCPGDSDQQEKAFGPPLPPGTPPERGDLMFWKGHVAWVADTDTLLHANAAQMAVSYEPLVNALRRIAAEPNGALTAHIRIQGR